LAQSYCERCHAIGKTGSSKHAEAPVFRDVVSRYPPASLAEALAEGISTGHPDMPEFVFSPDDISNLIAFLESIQ
jgi:cytochrome c2